MMSASAPQTPGLGTVAERVHPARPHVADPAAQPHFAVAALGELGLVAVPDGVDLVGLGFFQQQLPILGDGLCLVFCSYYPPSLSAVVGVGS